MQNARKPSFFRRNRIAIIVVAVIVIGGGWAVAMLSGTKSKTLKPREFTMVQVTLPPPPPPPPPPPREEPPPREDIPAPTNEMVVPDPIAADQPDAPTDDAGDDDGESMGTNVQSDGPADGFGLVGRGSGGTIGGRGIGSGGGSGNRSWDAYGSAAGNTIRSALSQHEKTRTASLRLPVSIWPDAQGVIERVRLDASSGDAELDRLLQTQVLPGLRLSGPPPPSMPLPIRIRITAQRPN